MGEYIYYHGKQIKLGTCESLYYVTFKQLQGMPDAGEYLNPNHGYRYRFPFPEEDNTPPGEHEPYNKHYTHALNQEHAPTLTAGIRGTCDDDDYNFEHTCDFHYFSDSPGYGINLPVPCPYHKDSIKKPSWTILGIAQQKQVDGKLWTVVTCPYCERYYRLDERMAIELCLSLKADADKYWQDQCQSKREYILKIVDRINAGYL